MTPFPTPSAPTPSPTPKPEFKMIFVGDIMLSRSVGAVMSRQQNYKYPFIKIADFLNSADLTVGNLEGPVSDRGTKVGSIYSFRADPRVVEGLTYAGFDLVSIANNHIWDYGKDALSDTLRHLRDAGIDYMGGGYNFEQAHGGVIKEVNGAKIAFLAYTDLLSSSLSATDRPGVSYLEVPQMTKDIKAARQNADMVVVSFHFGDEYKPRHNSKQAQIARAAIDAGATLIIGHHPHVVEDVEYYKNGFIAYSLGNFVFDQNFSKETMSGLALVVQVSGGQLKNVEKVDIDISKEYQPSVK
jgi:poly-gamma-glutamate synthesis protein (capsule biosynthesis protein)